MPTPTRPWAYIPRDDSTDLAPAYDQEAEGLIILALKGGVELLATRVDEQGNVLEWTCDWVDF